jgi:hypothetical protein
MLQHNQRSETLVYRQQMLISYINKETYFKQTRSTPGHPVLQKLWIS